jgi:hypothetical protein
MNLSRFSIAVLIAFTVSTSVAATRTITSTDPRPLSDIARQLEALYAWCITYEEAPRVHPSELEDIATSATKQANPNATFLAPKRSNISFQFDEPALLSPYSPHLDPEVVRQRDAAIDDIVRKATTGGGGLFQVIHNGDYSHIIPTAEVDAQGHIQAFQPILSTPVTIPAARRTVQDTVLLVLSQVATQRGFTISEGLFPTNMYLNDTVTFSSENEPARDVLSRLFYTDGLQWGSLAHRVTWDLWYSANSKGYYFNAHVLSDRGTALPPRKPRLFQRAQ